MPELGQESNACFLNPVLQAKSSTLLSRPLILSVQARMGGTPIQISLGAVSIISELERSPDLLP